MGLSFTHELTEAWVSLAAGAAAGVLYDLFRVIRRRAGSALVTAVLDAVFWVCVSLTLILLGLSAGEGKQQFFMTALMVAGAAVYFLFPSPWVVKLLDLIAGFAAYVLGLALLPVREVGKILKFFARKVKKLFSSSRFWYRIVNGIKADKRQKHEGGGDSEIQAHRYSYEDHHYRAAHLRRDDPRDAPHPDRRRGKPQKQARRSGGGHHGFQ